MPSCSQSRARFLLYTDEEIEYNISSIEYLMTGIKKEINRKLYQKPPLMSEG